MIVRSTKQAEGDVNLVICNTKKPPIIILKLRQLKCTVKYSYFPALEKND